MAIKVQFWWAGSLLIALVSQRATASDFTIESIDLDISAQRVPGDIAAHFFTPTQSPFVANHSVTLGTTNSTASAAYDYSWDETAGLGRFLMQSTMSADGVGASQSLISSSTSRIVLTPTVPLTVQVHGEFTFNAPADQMRVTFNFSALGLTTSTIQFGQTRVFDTVLGPGSGTMMIDGEFILPPTEAWRFRSIMEVRTGPGSLGHLGTGSGFVDIHITPEPAPAGLLLTAASMLILRRYSKRRPTACASRPLH